MPWREITDPYSIVVSEVMLQQTQVSRVMTKYNEWLQAFPDFETLATASAAEVLRVWQGLGYNRRALNLQKLAQTVVRDFNGTLPEQPNVLKTLPGIGMGTAGSIAAFAFNAPAVFIETNIRRVFIHHFFADKSSVSDAELLPLVEAAVDQNNPREWYYALMDYGVHLAKTVPNPNRQSRHYTKQSKFEGSDRQVRGEILRQLLSGPKQTKELEKLDPRVANLLPILEKEGFITSQSGGYQLG